MAKRYRGLDGRKPERSRNSIRICEVPGLFESRIYDLQSFYFSFLASASAAYDLFFLLRRSLRGAISADSTDQSHACLMRNE